MNSEFLNKTYTLFDNNAYQNNFTFVTWKFIFKMGKYYKGCELLLTTQRTTNRMKKFPDR